MKKSIKVLFKILLVIVAIALLSGIGYYIKAPYYFGEKAAFDDVYWDKNRIMVSYNDTLYQLATIEDKNIEEVESFAKMKFKDKWKHRIQFDYVYLMHKMGYWTYFSTNVQLTNSTGKIKKMKLRLTSEKRDKIMQAEQERCFIKRLHTSDIPDSLKFLTQRIDGYEKRKNKIEIIPNNLDFNNTLPVSTWINPDLAIRDLESLEFNIQNHYSYANLKEINYQLAIDAIIAGLHDGITKRDFGIQIKRLLALFGDGHTRISRSDLEIDSLFLPFKIISVKKSYVAVKEQNKLYNPEYPNIISIDGYTVHSLKRKAGELATKGSVQLFDLQSLEYITRYSFLQKQLGVKESGFANVLFSNGVDSIKVKVNLLNKKEAKTIFTLKESQHKMLSNNIGYIFLDKMDESEEYQEWLHKAMNEFKNTRGLIIDLRDNGGGSRNPIHTLLPYFIEKPKVINVNALRIDSIDDPNVNEAIGDLEERMSYPRESNHWNHEEKKAIIEFEEKFSPEWKLDRKYFSKWHFSVISPNSHYYGKPTIILMNEGNFSAADIFLAAFKGTKNVTLLGTPSGGGSGFVQVSFLANSGFAYTMSRIASFQPNGKLYDGNGVLPDIKIETTIENLRLGKDVVLETAIKTIIK